LYLCSVSLSSARSLVAPALPALGDDVEDSLFDEVYFVAGQSA
jgi:hypothetical protein